MEFRAPRPRAGDVDWAEVGAGPPYSLNENEKGEPINLEQYGGKLIFPGGKRELKRFTKDMKNLRARWVSGMRRKQRHMGIKMSTYQWADLADDSVEIFIVAEDTTAALSFIAGIGSPHSVQEGVYMLMVEASQIMAQHGVSLYQPGGENRDPKNFEAEALAILDRNQA